MTHRDKVIRTLLWSVQLATTLAVVLFLVWFVPPDQWVDQLARADRVWCAVTIGLAIGFAALDAWRIALLTGLPRRAQPANLSISFAAAIMGQLPLGLIGADAYRVAALRQLGIPVMDGIGATVLCRLLGLAALLLLGAIAGVAVAIRSDQLAAILALCAVLLTAGCGALCLALVPTRLPGLRHWTRLTKGLARFSSPAERLESARRPVLGLSLTLAVIRAAALYTTALAMGIPLAPDMAALACALAFLSTAIPLSFAGLGLREGGIAAVLALSGTAAQLGLVLAIMFRVLVLLGSAVGLVLALLFGAIIARWQPVSVR